MFVKNREHLLSFFEKLQKVTCSYGGSGCDCKYGCDPTDVGLQGERSGCPEIRMAMILLAGMTDEQFGEVLLREGGIPI